MVLQKREGNEQKKKLISHFNKKLCAVNKKCKFFYTSHKIYHLFNIFAHSLFLHIFV